MKKPSKKVIALAVVAAIVGALSVLYPDSAQQVGAVLGHIVQSGVFGE